MPLAEYLASEQAREDVRQLFDGDKPSLPVMSMEDLCLVRDEVGAWRSVMIWDDNQNKELTAYYRPDGDRFVVTDLGEGVRALRLKKGDVLVRHPYIPDGTNYTDVHSGVLVADPEPSAPGLPDAICRVMLASLRVAEVAP